jgi:hypothetical protein
MKDWSDKENEAATVPKRLIDRSGEENEAAMKDRSGKENEAAMKDRSGKENEAATVPKRLIDRSGEENEAAMKDRSGKENEAVTVLRRLINRSGKEKNVVLVPTYRLIGQSDKIAGLNLIEDNILAPSELSSEDPTNNEEDGPGDLILGKRPAL